EAAESFGLGPIAHHVAGPGFMIGTLGFVMNTARYDALPADLRAVIDETTGPAAAAALGRAWDAAEQHGRDYMAADRSALKARPADKIEHRGATFHPLHKDSPDPPEKGGKPAQAFLDAYRQ